MQIGVMCAMPAVPRRYPVRYSLDAYMSQRRRGSQEKRSSSDLSSSENWLQNPGTRLAVDLCLRIYDGSEKESVTIGIKMMHGIRATT